MRVSFRGMYFKLSLVLFVLGNVSRTNAFAAVPPLKLVAQKGEKTKGKYCIYDFGALNMMDASQRSADIASEDLEFKFTLPGLKHDFILQNQSRLPVSITNLESDSMATQSRVYKNEDVQDYPYVVAPGAKVRIRVAYDGYHSFPGSKNEIVYVRAAGFANAIAILSVQGRVESGVNFSPDAGKFGKFSAGQSATRDFTLTFDRRSPSRIPVGALRVVSSNPFVKIAGVPEKQVVQGVEVVEDQIHFIRPPDHPRFKENLVLSFRATVSEDAPPGVVGGVIRLVVEGAPSFLLVRNVVAPIQGEAVPPAPTSGVMPSTPPGK